MLVYILAFVFFLQTNLAQQNDSSVSLDFQNCKVLPNWTLQTPYGDIQLAGKTDGTAQGPDTTKPRIVQIQGKPALWMTADADSDGTKDRVEYLFLRYELNTTVWSSWDIYFPSCFSTPPPGAYFIARQW